MDFLIGGVPRSGTSIGGMLFNVHPRAFCYAAETHWVPFLSGVAGNAPVPAASLKNLRRVFASQNRKVLVDKVRRNVARGGDQGMLVFDARDIGELTDQAMALLEAGMFGARLCRKAVRILREHIQKKTGRTVIGEKTPSNVFAFRDYGALGAKAALMFMREPFAVIRSMQNRGRKNNDRSAAPFRSEVLGLIGMYVSYMEAVSTARAKPRTSVVHYEDLLGDPNAIIAMMFGAAGLLVTDQVLKMARRRLRVITPGQAWEEFSPGERSLILALTESARRDSPYGREFFSRLGIDAAQLGDPVPEAVNAFMPMYGVHVPAAGTGDCRLMRDSCIAIVHDRAARTVDLSLCADFPESVLAPGEAATLTARDFVDKRVIGSVEITGGRKTRTALSLALKDVTPICAGSAGSVGAVELNSSHAYRPSINPIIRFGIPLPMRSGDHRLMSFMLTGGAFS